MMRACHDRCVRALQRLLLAQRRYSCIAANYLSFDHLVSTGEKRGWHSEAQRLRGFDVDNQLEAASLYDRQIPRPGTLQNAIDIVRGEAEVLFDICPV